MNIYEDRLFTIGNPDNIKNIQIRNTYKHLAGKLTNDDICRIKAAAFYHGIGNDASELKDIKERLGISWNEFKTLCRRFVK